MVWYGVVWYGMVWYGMESMYGGDNFPFSTSLMAERYTTTKAHSYSRSATSSTNTPHSKHRHRSRLSPKLRASQVRVLYSIVQYSTI